ncbi:MAG TPA: hypothetical protein VE650_10365 [Acetobacteraceae bacterium]|nr:hypothetical protein [Acetobacteraceae bacterium]
MFRPNPSLAFAAVCVLLSACASQQQVVQQREDLLAAAGFTVRPANTPQRQTLLRTLPPNRFVQRVRGDQVVYLYADPLVCACLYVGDQAAYGRYRQEVFQRRLVSDQLLAAQMNQDAAWDWGPWGPGW